MKISFHCSIRVPFNVIGDCRWLCDWDKIVPSQAGIREV